MGFEQTEAYLQPVIEREKKEQVEFLEPSVLIYQFLSGLTPASE